MKRTETFMFNVLTSADIENCLAMNFSIRQFALAKVMLDNEVAKSDKKEVV